MLASDLSPALRFRLEDHSSAGFAVHDDGDGRIEAEMANAVGVFADGGVRGEPIPVDEAFTGVGVDGEVADLEGGQVLEEVAAL